MKLGILGTGMIVKIMLQTVDRLNFEEISILSTERSVEKAKELAEQYHIKRCYTNYDEMLESDVDVIYVGLPNHLHHEFSRKALLAKKHVIIEKPITSNTAELDDLIKLAEENNVMMFEASVTHYLPAFQALKRDLSKVGSVKIVSFNFSQYSSRYNAFLEGTIQPVFNYKMSGGALMDLNVYNVNALVSLFGMPESIHYSANIQKRIDTSGILTFSYPDLQAAAIGAKDCTAPLTSIIQGDKASIKINTPLSIIEAYDIIYKDGHVEQFRVEEPAHYMYYEFAEFIRMIQENDRDKCREMITLSRNVAEIMENARRQAGIVFGCEE